MPRNKDEKIIFHELEELPHVTAVEAIDVINRFPRHVHSSYIILLVEQGKRKIRVKNESQIFHPGEIIIIPPGIPHKCESISGDSLGPHSYKALCVTEIYMKQLTEEITGKPCPSPDFDACKPVIDFDKKSFKELFILLPAPGNTLEKEAALNSFLYQILLCSSAGNFLPEQTGPQLQALERVHKFITDNFKDKLSLRKLSEIGCISLFHLQKLFVNHYGISPQDLVTSCRVKEAEILLRQGLSLTDTALESGFSDQSHFSRQFKQVTGISPGRFVRDNLQRI